ncbi:hypothetical protein E2562_017365 [Oryza meyeriana var. granulata]|uniref:Uncharacterized protein n=1 Tax=Oryza meyeriana var. granulata TaxID=110450 RepID=A0A6G1D3I6_9ORYZ|nr:hypothetical protein E2562_017365 [Oryza meyeriana var. granulata]
MSGDEVADDRRLGGNRRPRRMGEPRGEAEEVVRMRRLRRRGSEEGNQEGRPRGAERIPAASYGEVTPLTTAQQRQWWRLRQRTGGGAARTTIWQRRRKIGRGEGEEGRVGDSRVLGFGALQWGEGCQARGGMGGGFAWGARCRGSEVCRALGGMEGALWVGRREMICAVV